MSVPESPSSPLSPAPLSSAVVVSSCPAPRPFQLRARPPTRIPAPAATLPIVCEYCSVPGGPLRRFELELGPVLVSAVLLPRARPSGGLERPLASSGQAGSSARPDATTYGDDSVGLAASNAIKLYGPVPGSDDCAAWFGSTWRM